MRIPFSNFHDTHLLNLKKKCIQDKEPLVIVLDQNSLINSANVLSPRISDIRFSTNVARIADRIEYKLPSGSILTMKESGWT